MDVNLNQSEVNRKYNMLAGNIISLQNQLEELRKEIASGGGGSTELPIMVKKGQEVLKLVDAQLISVNLDGELALGSTTIGGNTTIINSGTTNILSNGANIHSEYTNIRSNNTIDINSDILSINSDTALNIGGNTTTIDSEYANIRSKGIDIQSIGGNTTIGNNIKNNAYLNGLRSEVLMTTDSVPVKTLNIYDSTSLLGSVVLD